MNSPDAFRLGTVGPAAPGVEVRIADDGEILMRGPQIMRGLLEERAGGIEVLDDDGWLHTGDLGAIDDDGFLSITGRTRTSSSPRAARTSPPRTSRTTSSIRRSSRRR